LRHFQRYAAFGERNSENPAERKKNPGYAALPLRAVWQLDLLINETRPRLAAVACPLLVCRSRVDGTIPAANAAEIYGTAGSARKAALVLGKGWHVATLDNGKEELRDGILAFLKQNMRR
jgi:esterase/lipase